MPRATKPKPKIRKVTTETFEDQDEEQVPQVPWSDPEIDDGAENQVQSILEGLGGGEIKIKISKVGPKGPAYCFSSDGEIDEDFIQQQFGGGRYVGKIFVNGIFRQSFQLNIAERQGAAPVAAGGLADLQLRMLQQQNDFLRDVLLRGNGQQQTPVGELAQAMTTISNLKGGDSLGERAIDLFMKGLELGRTAGAVKEDSWTDIIKEALPVVGEMMKAKQSAQPNGAQGPVVNALPAAGAGDVIAQGIAYLKPKALRGSDPALYVEWLLENADEPQYQPILHFILTSDFSAFETIDPEIGKPPYREWFFSVFNGLRSAFASEDKLDVDSGGTAGNKSDSASNGKAGKAGGATVTKINR